MELIALIITAVVSLFAITAVCVFAYKVHTRRCASDVVIQRLVEHNEKISHLLLHNLENGVHAVHTQLVHEENMRKIDIEEQLAARNDTPVMDIDNRPPETTGVCGLAGVEV